MSLNQHIEEYIFVKDWLVFHVSRHWIVLTELDADEPVVTVKMAEDVANVLRDKYDAVCPAKKMPRKYWSDLYINRLDEALIKQCIVNSFQLVLKKLTKKERDLLLRE